MTPRVLAFAALVLSTVTLGRPAAAHQVITTPSLFWGPNEEFSLGITAELAGGDQTLDLLYVNGDDASGFFTATLGFRPAMNQQGAALVVVNCEVEGTDASSTPVTSLTVYVDHLDTDDTDESSISGPVHRTAPDEVPLWAIASTTSTQPSGAAYIEDGHGWTFYWGE